MPPKRVNNKKQQIKVATASSAADAEILNNGVKEELGEVLSLTNGTEALEAGLQEKTNAKTTKRNTGRGKNAAPIVLEQQTTVNDKKPVAKGRGKKKTNEIEVIQKENELEEQEVKEEKIVEAIDEKQADEEITIKPKGKGKKLETKTKSVKNSKTNEKIPNSEEIVQEEEISEVVNSVKEKPGKKSKVTVGKRKKQEVNDKQIENDEVKQDEIEEEPIEKGMHVLVLNIYRNFNKKYNFKIFI